MVCYKMRGDYLVTIFLQVGLIGMNESLLNFMGKDIGSLQGRKFTFEVLDLMREQLIKYQKRDW